MPPGSVKGICPNWAKPLWPQIFTLQWGSIFWVWKVGRSCFERSWRGTKLFFVALLYYGCHINKEFLPCVLHNRRRPCRGARVGVCVCFTDAVLNLASPSAVVSRKGGGEGGEALGLWLFRGKGGPGSQSGWRLNHLLPTSQHPHTWTCEHSFNRGV